MNQIFELGDSIHAVEMDTRSKKIKDKTLSVDLIFKSLVRGVGLGTSSMLPILQMKVLLQESPIYLTRYIRLKRGVTNPTFFCSTGLREKGKRQKRDLKEISRHLGFYSLFSSFGHSMEYREPEVSPFSGFRLRPDLASMTLNDLAADRQPDARALKLGKTVQPLEGLEDLLGILGVNADTVIFNPEDLVPISFFEGQLDDRALISDELQSITDKILVELR
jgi:hypothetical protein